MLKTCMFALCLIAAPSLALSPQEPQTQAAAAKCRHKRPKPCRKKCIINEWFSRSYHPTYFVKNTGVDGETLTMNDETIWAVASNSMQIVASWPPNSPIVISPSRWYSQYDYYLTNIVTNEIATVKLSQGPFVKHSILIQEIDWNTGFVSLSNGTSWVVRPASDAWSWQEGQAVLIGQSSRPTGYILININENAYLEAGYVQ